MLNWFENWTHVLVVLVIVAVVFLFVWKGKNWIGDRWEDYKISSAEKKQQEQQKVIDQKQGELDKAKQEQDRAVQQAKDKELEVEQYKDLIAKGNSNIQAAAKGIDEATKQYEQTQTEISKPASDYDRCLSLCSQRAELSKQTNNHPDYRCSATFCDRYK
jgi:preprotein translocase subunit SecF